MKHSRVTFTRDTSWCHMSQLDEIVALFVLCKFILQIRMRSLPVGLDVWFLVRPFVYFHTLCVQTAKALGRLRIRAVSPEPSMAACVISTIISWAGTYVNNNKGTDQPAHLGSLIRIFVVRCLDSIISTVAITEISSFYSWAGRFVSYLVGHLWRQFSYNEIELVTADHGWFWSVFRW